MSGTEWRVIFLVASFLVVAFALWMHRRLRTQYPGDTSKQMQSMLGFLRGTAYFAGIIFCAVIIEVIVTRI